MKKTLLFSVLAFWCVACFDQKEPVVKTWNIEKVEAGSADTISEKLYTGAYLSFYQEGKASFYQRFDGQLKRPCYFTGTWREYGSGLEISIDSLNLHKKFEIRDISSNSITLVINGDRRMNGTSFTGKSYKDYKTDTYDLLDPAINGWRQKPSRRESPEEIKARVMGHLKYLIAYFHVIDEKKQTRFELAILHTPIRFHEHGLSLFGRVEKNKKWRSCFYDYEDALAGATLLKESMRHIGKYPTDEESLAKGYHDALTIMAEYLERED